MPAASATRKRDAKVAVPGGTKRAVVYLRVSTPSQVNTDYDPEGISIPAQREKCEQKSRQLGDTEIVREFVEPGRTATSIDKRPVFQEMLAWVKAQGDIDYIIVYHFSRIFRNSIDAAVTKNDLAKCGTRVVSTILDMGDSPESAMVESIIHAVDQYQSQASGADISYKMSEKARHGGTVGRAPLGYLNTREQIDGREIRTVTPDPERAPLVTLAFELYASGGYTVEGLAETLTQRGLRTRPGKHPAGSVSTSKLAAMLQDRYYLGFVSYKGEEIPGRHEALVTPELFDRVAAVQSTRSGHGIRQRVHHHYLKGLLWCGLCHDQGRESRIIVQRAVGRTGGEYFYFFCRGKQEHVCDSRYLDIDLVEEAIENEYHRMRVDLDFVMWVRAEMTEALADQQRAAKFRRDDLAIQLGRLDRQEENLLDLASEGEMPTAKVRARLTDIKDQRLRLQAEWQSVESGLACGAAFLDRALELLKNPHELYLQMDANQRRLFNQAVFERVYVYDGRVTDRTYKEPFSLLIPSAEAFANPSSPGDSDMESLGDEVSSAVDFRPIQLIHGWSKGVIDLNPKKWTTYRTIWP